MVFFWNYFIYLTLYYLPLQKEVKNMPHKKIEIDLDKLESEISDYDKVIENANKVIEVATNERVLKTQLRDYITSNYSVSTRNNAMPLLIPSLDNSSKNSNQTGGVGQPTGISDFIRDYIKRNPNAHTTNIGKAYANHENVPFNADLKRKVSRALTRLKKAGEIDNKLKEGGKRAGSNWTYIKNN